MMNVCGVGVGLGILVMNVCGVGVGLGILVMNVGGVGVGVGIFVRNVCGVAVGVDLGITLVGTTSFFEAVGAGIEEGFILGTIVGLGVGVGLALGTGAPKRKLAKTKLAPTQRVGVLSFIGAGPRSVTSTHPIEVPPFLPITILKVPAAEE
jgi:hypothetical protein